MAKLMECKTCGESISKKAKACPHCGHSYEKKEAKSGMSLFSFLILIGFIGWLIVPSSKSTSPSHTSTYTPAKPKVHVKPATPIKVLTAKEKEERNQKEDKKVLTNLIKEMKDFNKFNAYKTLNNVSLNDRVATMRLSGKILNLNATKYKKTNPGLYKQAKAIQLKVQVKHYPKMRDTLGPILRQKMWEHDMNIKTIGKGYNRMVLTAALFASNRGIKQTRDTIGILLSDYRFQRVDFKWFKGAQEWSYYDLKNKKDNVL